VVDVVVFDDELPFAGQLQVEALRFRRPPKRVVLVAYPAEVRPVPHERRNRSVDNVTGRA
jgi:hypothetical protein